jgi:PKD repeat protein
MPCGPGPSSSLLALRAGRRLALCGWLLAAAAPACHTRSYAPDGGTDAPPSDASGTDAQGALALDFAATGCAHPDAGAPDGGVTPPCTGAAPLTLTFAPVSSAVLTRFRWTFGDGTPPSTERAPTHTYVLPGTYDVAVVAEGAGGGSLSRDRPRFVEVTQNGSGAPCNVDAQCGAGLFCLCGEGAPCGDGFSHGVCTSACPTGACAAGAACARLAVPIPVGAGADAGLDAAAGDAGADVSVSPFGADDAAAPIRDAGPVNGGPSDGASEAGTDAPADASAGAGVDGGSSTDGGFLFSDGGGPATDGGTSAPPPALCLATCASDDDCPTGLACRTLPSGAGDGAWTSVCVPPTLRRVGDSCRNARGQLDDGLCATGQCADLGALGLCTASCAAGASCPTGTACATFGSGRALCIATCSTSAPCTNDPLLACETGSGGGALGFVTSPPAPTATFCAPRSCTSQADCSPAGACTPLGVGAHCVHP